MNTNALNDIAARASVVTDRKPKLIDANTEAVTSVDARADFVNRGGNFTGILFTRPNYAEETVAVSADCTRIDFTRNGTDFAYQSAHLGKLPETWTESLMSCFRRTGNLYVVYSYLTPIAWTANAPGAGRLLIPEVPYTPTTNAHRRILTEATGAVVLPYE